MPALVDDGRRVVSVQDVTGSGKTLAYLLPLLSAADNTSATIQAVVVLPTRELCLQVCQCFLCSHKGGGVFVFLVCPLIAQPQRPRETRCLITFSSFVSLTVQVARTASALVQGGSKRRYRRVRLRPSP